MKADHWMEMKAELPDPWFIFTFFHTPQAFPSLKVRFVGTPAPPTHQWVYMQCLLKKLHCWYFKCMVCLYMGSLQETCFLFYFLLDSVTSQWESDLCFSQVKHHLVTPANESIQVLDLSFPWEHNQKIWLDFTRSVHVLRKSRNSLPEGETTLSLGEMMVLWLWSFGQM